MNRFLLPILILTVITLSLGVVSFKLFTSKPEVIENSPTILPDLPNGGVIDKSAASVELKTTEGVISVRNFYNDTTTFTDPVNEGYFQLGYYVDPASDVPPQVPYVVEYIASKQLFSVVLLEEPIAESRREAELYLINNLGITQDQMCSLNYSVSVPNRVNSTFAGVSLGFSFCSGSVSLD